MDPKFSSMNQVKAGTTILVSFVVQSSSTEVVSIVIIIEII